MNNQLTKVNCYQKFITNTIYILIYETPSGFKGMGSKMINFELKSTVYGIYLPCYGLFESDILDKCVIDEVTYEESLNQSCEHIEEEYLPDYLQMLDEAE